MSAHLRRDQAVQFDPEFVRAYERPASPLSRAVLYVIVAFLGVAFIWAGVGRIDVVATAPGKLVPRTFLKIVQPAEAGIVREILVTEGETVRQDQVLARMDTRLSQADRNLLRGDLTRRSLQLRRIDAEIAGVPIKPRADDPPDLLAQTDKQYRARRQAYLDALGAERATLIKAEHDLKAALESEEKLKKTLPIFKDQAESWEKLAKEGFAGRLMALDRQRIYLEGEQDLRVQMQNVAGLRALTSQANQRLSQISSNYLQQLQNERAEAEAHYHKLSQELEKHEHHHSLLELRSPQAGIVKDLATHTPGTVVTPGTILLTLVPSDDPLTAEVWVNNADAGFVLPEQKARLKLAAYPFQKFGMLDGAVRHISIDAQEKMDSPAGFARPAQDTAYRTLISLDKDHLDSQGKRLRLVPGMQVIAEIHLGTRSVMEYLLSPLQKVVHEAGRER